MDTSVVNNGKVRGAAALAFAVLALFLLVKTVGEVKRFRYIGADPGNRNTISVTGKAEKFAAPDLVRFTFTKTQEALVIGEAQKEVTERINDALAMLKEKGVAEKDIKTISYNVYPRYEYFQPVKTAGYYKEGKRVLAGYVVSQTIEAKVRKLDAVGDIIGQLGEIGVEEISSLSFEIDKEEDIRREARQEAIKDAQEKARELARDLGVRIVEIAGYSENGSYPPVFYSKMESFSPYAGDAANESPRLPAGENKLTSQVTITYEVR